MKDSKKRKEKVYVDTAVTMSNTELTDRYSSAGKEHVVAYSGNDNESGQTLKKSLKSISQEKVDPNYKKQNLKQQSGFSAEVKETAKANAESIINGSDVRKTRTDDIGNVNDQLYDHVEIDSDGKIITGSGTQMKFVGKDPKDALGKLQSKNFDKYRENNVKIEVPSDFYDEMVKEADIQIADLKNQASKCQSDGNNEKAKTINEKIKRLQDTKNSLKKSHVSTKEAEFARLHPKLSTAKDVADVSIKAGNQAAVNGFKIGSTVSLTKNIVSVIEGNEDIDEAIKNIAKDTAQTTLKSHINVTATTAVKSVMKNAKSKTVRNIAKSSVPDGAVSVSLNAISSVYSFSKGDISGEECASQIAEQSTATFGAIAIDSGLKKLKINKLAGSEFPFQIATAAVSTTKTVFRFINGDIDGIECLEQIGQDGANLIASSVFSLFTTIALPGHAIVSSILGALFGYALSSSCYKGLVATLADAAKEAKMAKEERERIEREVQEHIRMLQEYRTQLEHLINEYLSSYSDVFRSAFDEIKQSLEIGDIDGYISSMNIITKSMGKEALFENKDEFEKLMNSSEKIIL